MPFDDDDDDFNQEPSDEEMEAYEKERKEKKRKLRKHPLFVQANEILQIVDTLLDTSNNQDEKQMYGSTLRDSAMIIVTKLSSGLQSDDYVQCMQKAALIRDHAEYLRLSNHTLNHLEGFDKKYVKMFRSEMEKFRALFREWALEIHQLDPAMDDEWGLFVK